MRRDGYGKRWLASVVVALLALVSGCALSRPPTPAEVLEQSLPKGTAIPPGWSSVTDMSAVTNDWLASFQDPGLDAVVAEGIANNLDLRQATARVEVARQTVVVVGSQLLPQIGVQAGVHGTLDNSGQPNQSNLHGSNMEYVGMLWEIDLWGRLRSQRAASEASFQATALDYAFARQSLAATVAKSWYLAIETRQLVGLAEESVRIYTQLLELVNVRRAAGKVADLDVAEARANLSQAEGALRTAEGRYIEARRTLELLLSRYPAAELAVAEAFAPLPPPIQAGLPSSLLARRPDLVATERLVLAAFRQQEAARLALLPSFSLNSAS